MSYRSIPVDTSSVQLSREVLALTEILARNAHESWTRGRIAEGWRYGPVCDDARKEHPGLVPYEELSGSEREYDRTTTLEAIKTLVALGYRIEAPSATDSLTTVAETHAHEEAAAVLAQLKRTASGTLDLAALLAVWRARNPRVWQHHPAIYAVLAERILKTGEPLIAHDILTEGLKHAPRDVRLRQLQALALSRTGAVERANKILADLVTEGHANEETLGLLARTHKGLWAQAAGEAERERHLNRAYETYAQAYRASGGYYTGINAATMALVSGRSTEARRLAREVRALCVHELQSLEGAGRSDNYWLLATLGEAALILGDWREAGEWYSRAALMGRGRYGELNSTRRNARLLVQHLGADGNSIERHFSIPKVVVFAGHMIDHPNRTAPRFPPALEEPVRLAIRARLEEIDAGFGYSSAACGADILFIEAMRERGAETHVVLPYNKQQFKEDSVDFVADGAWSVRCDAALEYATAVSMGSKQRMEGGMSFEYTNLLLEGLATIHARHLETELVPLAAWDGCEGDGGGGTASTVAHWRAKGHTVEIIDIAEILRSGNTRLPPRAASVRSAPIEAAPEFAPRMVAMLFADTVNFSKLTEEQLPTFIRHFLGRIGELTASVPAPPIMKNTWGDGLYFVFSTVGDAGRFALRLSDLMNDTSWTAVGLPKDLNLRIALHAGPVYSCLDPITYRPNFIGTHVSRAARMEPVTPPGQVYASQAFAALAAAEGVADFACEYVGQMPLAKGYGTFPTYLIPCDVGDRAAR
jgi:class 3 adenylate cyclase